VFELPNGLNFFAEAVVAVAPSAVAARTVAMTADFMIFMLHLLL
jgi:hypothetical protein